MYSKDGDSSHFTIPLRHPVILESQLENSAQAQIVLLLHKSEKTKENQIFLDTFIEALPFMNEASKAEIQYIDEAPSWSTIQAAFPKLYTLMLVGFSFRDIHLQFRSTPYLLVLFTSRHLMQLPSLDKWKSEKKAKMIIWKQLKTIPPLT